jgi:DNA ligase-1
MRHFAALYQQLDETTATGEKLLALQAYFSAANVPDHDKAWALWLLLGNRLKRLIAPSALRGWAAEWSGLSPTLIEAAYAQVGDLAETLALLVDTSRRNPLANEADRALSYWVNTLQALAGQDPDLQKVQVFAAWQQLPREQAYLFNKLLTGALRVGVSAGLAARALAQVAGLPASLATQRLMGEWQPSAAAWSALLEAPGTASGNPAQPYPFCLASPLEAAPETLGAVAEYLAEWKWDGIRAQIIRRNGQTWIWSRGEELLNGRFPEVEAQAARLPEGCVVDGEILAWRDDAVLPFALLQKRIGRKTVGKKLLAEAPVGFMAYDLLEWQGEDWRARPLLARRTQLEATGLRLSPRIDASSWAALAHTRLEARQRNVEGLMLKRLDSPYQTGRKRGAWWKWKLDARSVDCVLLYAQAGHGRRANLYTDYTLAVWDAEKLVPVTKAYSGLTDVELAEMDRWIRKHTLETFGPVRSVQPVQVFEIAFEGIQPSPRHKAGVALRFPRIARWRKDKLAAEADTLEALKTLLAAP